MRRRAVPLLALVAGLLAACTPAPGPPPEPSAPAAGSAAPSTVPSQPPSPRALPWGPTAHDLDAAGRAVAAMTPAQLAGQVLVARYPGTDPAAAAAVVERSGLAGVIVMGDNVAGAEQLRATAAAVQQAVAGSGRPWPAVVAVDQEGGRVARVSPPSTEFPAFMTHGAADDAVVTRAAAAAAGAELRALGFTVVFAPVADVTSGPQDPTIGSRAASDDPDRVARAVTAAVRGYRDAGVVAVAKHYPGHGSVPADSHETLPVQEAADEELAARDLVPFAAAAAAGVPAVMVGHLAVQAWEPGVPASLSPAAYAALRGRTGFAGVAVTDALDMAAVTGVAGGGDAAVQALAAGADLLLMPPDAADATAAVAAAVADGTLPRARVEEAAARVVALLRHQARAPEPSAVPGAAGPASYAASLAALTVLDGRCEGRLVGDAVQVVGGTAEDRARFEAAARAAGLATGSGDVVRLLGGPTTPGSPSPGEGDVVVALDAPYGLAGSPAGATRIALFGRTPQAFAALVDVLLGRARGGGTLPVAVPGEAAGAGCG